MIGLSGKFIINSISLPYINKPAVGVANLIVVGVCWCRACYVYDNIAIAR